MKANKNVTILVIGLVIILLLSAVYAILNVFDKASPGKYRFYGSNENLSTIRPLMRFLEINDIKSVEEVNLLTASNKSDNYEIVVSYTSKDGRKKEEIKNISAKSVESNKDASEAITYIMKNSEKLAEDKLLSTLKNISLVLVGFLTMSEIGFVVFLIVHKR